MRREAEAPLQKSIETLEDYFTRLKNTIIRYISAGNETVLPRQTLMPFLKDAEEHLKFKYKNITVDAGYESEENYLFLEANGQLSYIKPANYKFPKPVNTETILEEWKTWSMILNRTAIPAEMGKS